MRGNFLKLKGFIKLLAQTVTYLSIFIFVNGIYCDSSPLDLVLVSTEICRRALHDSSENHRFLLSYHHDIHNYLILENDIY